jgi:hypothetical protein
MQDISPDMEDLLRKASEAYPLKDTGDRWNEIASRITAPQDKGRKPAAYPRYLFLALLLLLSTALNHYFFYTKGSDPLKIATVHKASPEKTSSYKQNHSGNSISVAAGGIKNKNKNSVQPEKKSNGSSQRKYVNPGQISAPVTEAVKPMEIAAKTTGNKPDLPEEATPLMATDVVAAPKLEAKFEAAPLPLNPENVSPEPEKAAPPVPKKKNHEPALYYGVVAGPELNATKSQQVKKAGWKVGLIGGYSLSNRVSVETGVLFSRKFYTSPGERFSMKEIGATMPSTMKILDVEGSSKLIEIPVSVQYHVLQTSKRKVSFSAGVSSYVLTTESNRYHTLMNGTSQMMYGTYKNNRRYLAASVDLGLSYAQNFGTGNTIRLQPYLQIPARGMGVGQLNIRSAGLRIAITHTVR